MNRTYGHRRLSSVGNIPGRTTVRHQMSFIRIMKKKTIISICVLLLLASCHNHSTGYQQSHEDKQAKEMLQGLWTNGENSDPAMLVRGDSIFYPDSASMPVRFWVYQDTLYLQERTCTAIKSKNRRPIC